MASYLVRWEINVDADDPRGAAQQARALQADPETWCQTFTVIDSLTEASTTIDLANIDAKLAGEPRVPRPRRETVYGFGREDLEDLPYFSIIEGKGGQCSRGGVRGVDWELFECVRYCQEVCDELAALGISVADEEPERVNESARSGYDDLDAALDFLNEGGRLCKVPDTMDPGCCDYSLYRVR